MSFFQKYKPQITRWAISSLDTFLAVFIPTLLVSLQAVTTFQQLTWAFIGASLSGAAFAGIRAVIKATRESLTTKYHGK